MPRRVLGIALAAVLVLGAAVTAAEDGGGVKHVTLPDGAVVALTLSGSGPPLLFIHGWAGNRQHWRAQVPAVATDHTVVALDLPGHGESTGDRDVWTKAAAMKAVAAPIRGINAQWIPTAREVNRKYSPGYDAIVLEGVGHFLQLEAPERFNQALRQILQSLAAASAGSK